jgi:hypothetical protein
MRALAGALPLGILSLGIIVSSLAGAAQEPPPLPDPKPFLEEVRKRLQTDEQLQSGYTYVETRRQLKLDKSGRSTKETVKVVESYPGLPGEERWERLISEDGKPVPAAELEKRDRERQKKAQEYVRKLEREPEKLRREHAREREKYFREMAEAVDNVFLVYEMRMLGREAVEGHSTIAFALTPRPHSKPRNREGRIMKHFTARVWVSESEYELVRLDVEAIDTVPFGLGLLARVHKGSRLSFTRRKVNNEVWLPASANYTASARIGLIKMMRVGGTSEFSNYRKFTVDTTTTYSTK